LVLLIEGTGRNPDSGEVMFRALATVAYDDVAGVYHFRAYNEGSYLDTGLKVRPEALSGVTRPDRLRSAL
jgi:hypothetical protein